MAETNETLAIAKRNMEIAAPKRVRLFIRDCDEPGREWLLKQFVSKVEGEDGSLISGYASQHPCLLPVGDARRVDYVTICPRLYKEVPILAATLNVAELSARVLRTEGKEAAVRLLHRHIDRNNMRFMVCLLRIKSRNLRGGEFECDVTPPTAFSRFRQGCFRC